MTRDNNETRKKVNAIFFAAIMVISMVAVGFAGFAGSAAAVDDDSVSLDFDYDEVESGEEDVTTEAQVTADNVNVSTEENATVEVEVPDGASINDTDAVTVDNDGTGYSATVESVTDTTVTVNLEGDADEDENIDITVNYAIDYPSVSEGEDRDATATVTGIDGESDSDTHTVTIHAMDWDGADDEDVAEAYDVDRAVAIDDLGDAALWQGQRVAVYDVSANTDIQLREVTGDTSTSLRAERTSDASGVVIFNTANRDEGQYIVRDTASGASPAESGEFDIVTQDLSVDADPDEVDNTQDTTVDFDVESNRGSFAVDVSADGLDDDDLQDIFGDEYDVDDDVITITDVAGDGVIEADFDGIDADEYDFDFDVTDTTAADSASVTVTEGEDADIEFDESFINADQGDVAEITLNFDGDAEEAFLLVGDDDIGYTANVTVNSDGADQVTVYFNLYAAGQDEAPEVVFWAEDPEDEDSPTAELDPASESETNGALEAGDYELEVGTDSFEHVANESGDNPLDLGTLVIDERSTDSISFWTAPDDVDRADADEIDAGAGHNITQSDHVAADDLAIFEVQASGLTGALEWASHQVPEEDEDDVAAQLAYLLSEENENNDDARLEIRVRQTDDSRQANQPRKTIDMQDVLDNDDSDVVIADGALYIITDSDDFDDVEDGDEFDTRFSVQDTWLLGATELDDDETHSDYYERVTTTFAYEDRDGDFDADPVEVLAEEDQAISGTTNVAPGTEFNLRVRSASGVQPGFIMTESASVDADRTFAGSFDFSEASEDDEFTVRVRQAGFDAESDGIVVDSIEEDTPTPTPTPDEDDETPTPTPTPDEDDDETPTPTPDQDDDTPTPDEDDDDEPTEDDTPGFGAVVALIALIAAALLATRRRP